MSQPLSSFSEWRFNTGQIFDEYGKNFLYNIRLKKRPTADPNASLERQTAIITGGNKGIGGEVTKDLVSRGCRVIIACRDTDQANHFAKELNDKERQNPKSRGGEVLVKRLDLASADSIRFFVNEVCHSCDKIDILINNAAVLSSVRTEVAFNGEDSNPLEFTMAVNYFGTVLLTLLLVELVRKSSDPRVIFISSQAYLLCDQLRFNDLHYIHMFLGEEKYDGLKVYSHSKLALMYFIKLLAPGMFARRGIRVYAVDPGVSITGLSDSLTACERCMYIGPQIRPFMRSIKGSANAAIMCVFADRSAYDPSVFYFTDGKPKKLRSILNDETALRTVWRITKETLSMNHIMDSLNIKRRETEL